MESSGRTPTTSRAALTVAFVALFTDMLVYGIAVPVVPLFPAVAAGGDAAAGALFAAYAAALVAVTPVAGRWLDRSGPRGPLLAGLVGLALATLLFAAADPFWVLLLARVAQGASAACSWVAGLALVAAVSPIETRASNLGLVLSATSLGVLVGPAAGGFLADLGGRHLPFVVAAGLALLDGVLRLLLVRPVDPVADDPGTVRGVWRVPGAASACTLVAVGAGIIAVTEPVLPPRLNGLGFSPTETGLVYGAAVLASAVTTPVAGSLTRRVSIPVLCAVGAIVGGLALAGVGVATHPLPLIVGLAVIGAGSGLLLGAITPVMSRLGMLANPPALGAAFAVFNLAYAVGLFAGPALGGTGAASLDFGTAMTVVAALCTLAAVVASARLHARADLSDLRPPTAD